MKKIILALTVCALVMLPMAAMALPIAADNTGSRAVGSGVTTTDTWAFTIDWVIGPSADPNYLYNYCYTITTNDPKLSHWSLQITEGKNLSDFANFKIVNDGFPNGTPFITLEFPSPEIASGIKFDEVDDYGEYYVNTFYFDTNLPPVWGDFYAKGGQIFAYNNGFGIEPAGTNFTDWIARPDGIVVPIPGSVLLMGSGLLGLIGIRRKLS